jgi:hypothetical protein
MMSKWSSFKKAQLMTENWRRYLEEAPGESLAAQKERHAAELAKLKSYAGKSALEILQMQDDGSAEFAKIKDILGAAEKQKKEALKNLQAQEKAYAAEKEEWAREAEERVKERTAMMDKFEAQMQQMAQQSNSPAAAAIAAAQDAETEKLKQKSAQIEQEFNKRMDAVAAAGGTPKQKKEDPNFIQDKEGAVIPNNKKGEDMVLKDPQRAEEWIKYLSRRGNGKFSTASGRPIKDLVAIAQQNKG